MIVPRILADIRNGAIVPATALDRSRYRRRVQQLEGQRVEVALRKPRSQRSYDQLRYWFGIPMQLMAEETGYTKLQQHYLCLALCFGTVPDASGIQVPVVPASRHLTTRQFSDLIEWAPPFAMEHYRGLEIPMPGEIDIDSLPGVTEME